MALHKGALSAEFGRRRRGLTLGEALPVLADYEHPLSGARLILAKIERKPHPPNGVYIVGWLPPDETIMWFFKNFETQAQARAAFQAQKRIGPPVKNDFQYDPQMNDVYDWEDQFRLKTRELSLGEMRTLTSNLSEIFNVAAPDVVYKPGKKKKTYAEASLQDSVITMYRPNIALLLHEFAHLINDQINKDKWAWHGAGFMRTYLSILSLFPSIKEEEQLLSSALERKLRIANTEDVPACRLLQRWLKHHQTVGEPSTKPSPT